MRAGIGLLAAVVVALLTFIPTHAGATPHDPWYEDVSSRFWAYREIRVMWEEECADGWVFTRWRWTPWGDWEETVARFYPNDHISRAQYALLMAKTFRLQPIDRLYPTFSDVPRGFCLYGDKPAYGHIEALAARGWILGVGNGQFMPHHFIERQHAVAILLRALGLGPFARAMAAEGSRYLDRFPDGYQVDPSVAPEMALAIRLGIVIGYDDGRLHPRDHLWRCQAVALMVRSALIDVTAEPPRLSPDGDGVEDTAGFTFRTLKNRSTRKWSLSVGNLEGQWYRSFYPEGCPGEPPPSLSWDGRDDGGWALPDGTYFYRAWITDSRGETWRSALKPITLERRRLWGHLEPTQAAPGDGLTIRASTTGGAQRVTAQADGTVLELTPSSPPGPVGSNDWYATFRAPAAGEEGPRPVRLLALFTGTTRALDLTYYLRDPISLTGTLDPNPARAGTRVRVLAFTSPNVSSVRAQLPWGEQLTLLPRESGGWAGSFRTLPSTPDGTYPVLLEARAGPRSRHHPLQLIIQGSSLEDLVFTLSD
ncbi:MAG: S-layer homology domain-containing protein [Firmicutes bacterium]|nr:S-layer homology domain-containing protein [Bacillota bacterium]